MTCAVNRIRLESRLQLMYTLVFETEILLFLIRSPVLRWLPRLENIFVFSSSSQFSSSLLPLSQVEMNSQMYMYLSEMVFDIFSPIKTVFQIKGTRFIKQLMYQIFAVVVNNPVHISADTFRNRMHINVKCLLLFGKRK